MATRRRFCGEGVGSSLASVVLLLSFGIGSALRAPANKCYALDKNDRLYDFTSLAGKTLSGNLQDGGTFTAERLMLRLCQDAYLDSPQRGNLSFGRFAPGHIFRAAANSSFRFQQHYLYGDLAGCGSVGFGADGGRATKVLVSCDTCPDGTSCQDDTDYGCICTARYSPGHEDCIIEAVIALHCGRSEGSIFRGFSVGLNPRSQEVVEDGVTLWGYASVQHSGYSYDTEQGQVSLYLSALSALASRVQSPTFSVVPAVGLHVSLSGSAMEGAAPTAESPSVLQIEWRCDVALERPYLVNITVPVEGYPPVSFLLGKHCKEKQKPPAKASPGWATFGAISCSFLVFSTAVCCVGFVYKTHAEDKRGLEALPGLSALSGCLDMGSGLVQEYFPSSRGDRDQYPDTSDSFVGSRSSSYGSVS